MKTNGPKVAHSWCKSVCHCTAVYQSITPVVHITQLYLIHVNIITDDSEISWIDSMTSVYQSLLQNYIITTVLCEL